MGKSDDVRTTVSVKTLTVSSVEELNTRSMSLSACPCDLLVTVGSHEQQSISRRAPPPGRHFWSRARMGLWSGVRARFDTVSITVYRSLNAVTRGKSRALPPAASRVRALFAGLETPVPLDAQRLLRFACGFHGRMVAHRLHAPMKTAMEKEQRHECERYRSILASGPSGREKNSSYQSPYHHAPRGGPVSLSHISIEGGAFNMSGLGCHSTYTTVHLIP